MDLFVADWSLAELTRLLLYGNYAGSIALLLGIAMAREPVPAHGRSRLAPRVGGLALALAGGAGWVLPWCAIWLWYRGHLP